jgi:hypothetical protein
MKNYIVPGIITFLLLLNLTLFSQTGSYTNNQFLGPGKEKMEFVKVFNGYRSEPLACPLLASVSTIMGKGNNNNESSFNQNNKAQAENDENSAIYGITVGLGYGKLKTNDAADNEFDFKPSYAKIIGFTLELPIPKLEKKGVFYNELTLSQFESNSSVHIPDTSLHQPERDYYDISQKFAPNIVSLTTMFRYCFVNNDFKYYVSAGIYNSFVISPANRKYTFHTLNGVETENVEPAVPDLSTHGLMLIIGTGISYKYAGLEFRFDPGRNYTNKVDYSVYNPTVSVQLNVRFNP